MKVKNGYRRSAWVLALVAGAMDFATGLGLMVRPEFTLNAMRVSPPATEAVVFIRFIGAFVAGVGATYLLALCPGGAWRLRAVFESTLLIRLAVGLFTTTAVVQGWLSGAWATVAVTDLGLAVVQGFLLWRGIDHGG